MVNKGKQDRSIATLLIAINNLACGWLTILTGISKLTSLDMDRSPCGAKITAPWKMKEAVISIMWSWDIQSGLAVPSFMKVLLTLIKALSLVKMVVCITLNTSTAIFGRLKMALTPKIPMECYYVPAVNVVFFLGRMSVKCRYFSDKHCLSVWIYQLIKRTLNKWA